MLPFEFTIDGPPVSQQTRRRSRLHDWKKRVRQEAEQKWSSGELPHSEPIMLTIIYFYDTASMDVDNIPKPISDALNGLVYFDDEQITDILVRKRNLNDDLRLTNPSDTLTEGFVRGSEFLYIVIKAAPNQGVI